MKISSLKNTKLYAFASTDIGTRQENQDNYLIIQKEEDRITAKYLKDEQELVKPINNWNGPTGFIHSHLIESYLNNHEDPTEIEYYLCGPPLMIDAVISSLYDLGVEDDMIYYDKF
jgi:Na+-transporting NADH:ubiquinone oxidoreductase, subunit NqrF